jgi:hypothetical protein
VKARFVSLLAASLTLGFALTACDSSDQGALPAHTAGSPSTTATSQGLA